MFMVIRCERNFYNSNSNSDITPVKHKMVNSDTLISSLYGFWLTSTYRSSQDFAPINRIHSQLQDFQPNSFQAPSQGIFHLRQTAIDPSFGYHSAHRFPSSRNHNMSTRIFKDFQPRELSTPLQQNECNISMKLNISATVVEVKQYSLCQSRNTSVLSFMSNPIAFFMKQIMNKT